MPKNQIMDSGQWISLEGECSSWNFHFRDQTWAWNTDSWFSLAAYSFVTLGVFTLALSFSFLESGDIKTYFAGVLAWGVTYIWNIWEWIYHPLAFFPVLSLLCGNQVFHRHSCKCKCLVSLIHCSKGAALRASVIIGTLNSFCIKHWVFTASSWV